MRVDDVSLLVVVTHRALYLESGVVEGRCGGTARAVGIRAPTRRNEPLRPVELRPVLPSVEEHNLAGQAVEPPHTVAGELRIEAEPVGLRAPFQSFARLSAEDHPLAIVFHSPVPPFIDTAVCPVPGTRPLFPLPYIF